MSGVSYNLGMSKPLINREQNFVLDRRLLSVHSTDRDITKYPNSNYFEILLPETMYNVQSLRLVQCDFPGNYYVFSNDYQNTKMSVTYINNAAPPATLTNTLTITSGLYSGTALALELTTQLNALPNTAGFVVAYNQNSQKFTISKNDAFNLNFNQQIIYDVSCNNYTTNPIMWNQYANWGLPYYLGFKKLPYTGAITYTSDYTAPISGETCIYMEVDKYNSYDELYPYNKSSCQMYDNNAYSGKVNSAFAKIPIKGNTIEQDARTFFLQNTVQYDPPIERIARLIFKFRFHDGRLVDFQNKNFDFTIEFN
jgi:hypothetical protein